jgi:hypothetical protein
MTVVNQGCNPRLPCCQIMSEKLDKMEFSVGGWRGQLQQPLRWRVCLARQGQLPASSSGGGNRRGRCSMAQSLGGRDTCCPQSRARQCSR